MSAAPLQTVADRDIPPQPGSLIHSHHLLHILFKDPAQKEDQVRGEHVFWEYGAWCPP